MSLRRRTRSGKIVRNLRKETDMASVIDRLASDEEIRTFHEDGAVRIRNVISREWLDIVAEGFAQAMASPSKYAKSYGPKDAARYYTDHKLYPRFEPFRRFITEGPLAQVAAEILGASRIDVYDEHLLLKEPGAPAPTYWHHDMPYFSIEGYDLASIWFALDPVTEETGALRFAKGSHKWGKLYRPVRIGENKPVDAFNRDVLIDRVPDIDADPETYPTVLLEVDPGDIVVFHGLTLHASGGNKRTDLPRRAVSYRFAGDDIRWKNRADAPLVFERALNDGDPLSLYAEECPQVWPRA
jgi:ectoine hydroxylase-related dioxygenase (phytanoyl-CoA dioxygenase family)